MDGDYLRLSAGAGLGLVGLGSVPAAHALIHRVFAKKQARDEIYQDADGKSTPEAQAKFSNTLPKFLVIFFASIGLAGSLAVGVLVTQGRGGRNLFLDSWFNAGAWVSTSLIHFYFPGRKRRLAYTCRTDCHTLK